MIFQTNSLLGVLLLTGLLAGASTTTTAAPIDGLWLSRIQLRDCLPGTTEDPRYNCTSSGVNTLRLRSDYDTAVSGETYLYDMLNLATISFISSGYTGPAFAPAVSGVAFTKNGFRYNSSSFGFQRYSFIDDGTLNIRATLTYSQTGQAESQVSRNPRGYLDGGVTVFQMDDNQFDPEDCNLLMSDAGGDITSPNAIGALLTCLIANGLEIGSTNVEFTGLQNFQNFEFLPPIEATSNGSIITEFSIDGVAGDVWFLTADLFLFAHNAGWVNTSSTLLVEIENPELVQAAYPVESFQPAQLPQVVSIDVRPGPGMSNVDAHSTGSIPVAILGSDELAVLDIDVESLRLGVNEATPISWGPQYRDIDRDGHIDLVVRFGIYNTGIACGDTEIFLSGFVEPNSPIVGSSDLRVVGCD